VCPCCLCCVVVPFFRQEENRIFEAIKDLRQQFLQQVES